MAVSEELGVEIKSGKVRGSKGRADAAAATTTVEQAAAPAEVPTPGTAQTPPSSPAAGLEVTIPKNAPALAMSLLTLTRLLLRTCKSSRPYNDLVQILTHFPDEAHRQEEAFHEVLREIEETRLHETAVSHLPTD